MKVCIIFWRTVTTCSYYTLQYTNRKPGTCGRSELDLYSINIKASFRLVVTSSAQQMRHCLLQLGSDIASALDGMVIPPWLGLMELCSGILFTPDGMVIPPWLGLMELCSGVVFYEVLVLSKESLWVFLCIPLLLLGNGSVNTFPRQRGIVGGIIFFCGPCRIEGK
jgi:hypothetical protein